MSKARDFGDLAEAMFNNNPEDAIKAIDGLSLDDLNAFARVAAMMNATLGNEYEKRMTEYLRSRPRPFVWSHELDQYWPDEPLGANDPEL